MFEHSDSHSAVLTFNSEVKEAILRRKKYLKVFMRIEIYLKHSYRITHCREFFILPLEINLYPFNIATVLGCANLNFLTHQNSLVGLCFVLII